jgi:glycosyltransferase involved in cell wall biosynthesis
MKRRLVILTEIISPYRIPLFNCLAQDAGVDLHVIFLSENDPALRQWKVYKEEIRFSYEVLPSWRRRAGKFNVLLNAGVIHALQQATPQAILCGGYNYVASWQALAWARFRNVPFLLWSESNPYDARRGHALVEMLKAEFFHNCDGFVVPGRSAKEYLRAHKIRSDRIFTAPNAIDNDLFSSLAQAARQDATAARRLLDLPSRYILFVGRLVQEKGVFELLRAYATLDQSLRRQIGLVFVGDGPCRPELLKRASAVTDGAIRFPGFVQREQLPAYYALAEMFVLPTYTDTWGLVVNEAMACGLPVIVSRVAGCASDLIRENWNGLLAEPKDISSLSSAVANLATQPDLCASMGAHARQHIAQYSPGAWSMAIADALKVITGTHG